jgi:hypothetical protein
VNRDGAATRNTKGETTMGDQDKIQLQNLPVPDLQYLGGEEIDGN